MARVAGANESENEGKVGLDGADWASICDEEEAEDARNNCWDERRLRLAEASKRTLLLKSLEFLLFVHNYDLWAILKQTPAYASERQRVVDARRPQAALVECHRDRGQHRAPPSSELHEKCNKWTRFLRIFCVYLIVKTIIVSIAQHTLMKYEYLVPRGHKPPLLPLEYVQLLCAYLGNPLHMLKDSSLILYLGPPGVNAIFFVLVPLHYARRPLNIPTLRFIMRPLQELERVDWALKRELARIRSSLEVYKQQKRRLLLEGRDKLPSFLPVAQLLPFKRLDGASSSELLALELAYCAHLSAFLDRCERRLHSLRPETFSARYLERSAIKMSGVLACIHLIYWLGCLVLICGLEIPPYLDRCSKRGQAFEAVAAAGADHNDACTALDIRSLPQALLLLELPVALVIGYWVASLNLDLFTIVSLGQMRLVKSVKSQLLNCTRLIVRNDNQTHLIVGRRADFRARSEARLILHRANGFQDDSCRRLDMDEYLLRVLIKLVACERELRANARNLWEQLMQPIFYAAVLVFLALLNGQLKIPDSDAIRRFTVSIVWLNCNAVAIACAHVFARVLETERIMWRLLANNAATFLRPAGIGALPAPSSDNAVQTLRKQRLTAKLTSANCELGQWPPELRCCSFVTDLWIKFVRASSLNIDRYTPRPFGVKLTYQAIIELNFFIIFVYSLSFGNTK